MAISQLGIVGCDGGVYSATSAGDGTVVVVNRLNRTIQRVQGNKVVELATTTTLPEVAPAKVEDYHPVLANTAITQQPVTVVGRAKYRTGNMFLMLTLRPENPTMKEEEWRAWRSHMAGARSVATLHITFDDADGFQVSSHVLSVAEMVGVVDNDGQVRQFEDQTRIPMSAEDYRAITGWEINWAGWPPYVAPYRLEILRLAEQSEAQTDRTIRHDD
jgi:hypothetical protein